MIRKIFLLIITIFFINNSVGFSQISFLESANASGLTSTYGAGEFAGAVSFYDYNNDGWDDITIATQDTSPILFFKNVNGTFVADNITIADPLTETKQVQWVDFDNDGDNDFFITSSVGANYLFENDGSFGFTDITASAGLNTPATNSWGASWGDFNNDGFLDVFISFRKFGDTQPNVLFKNNGDATFINVSASAGINQINDPTFCAAFFDYNNDGWQDIFVTNHKFSQSYLYKNNGDETFTDVSIASGAGIISDGMSTTIGDFNNDGWFDVYITNIQAGNFFLKNNGDGTFTNISDTVGTVFSSIAWGAVFLDADNDTDLDLYVSGMLDGSIDLPSAFYEQLNDGTFEIPTGIGFDNDTAESYSNAIGDVNNDGFPDIFVINQNANNYLWKNTSASSNNWLKVNLVGVNSNKDAIGSRIEIQVNGNSQYRYTLNGEGYIAQNSKTEFFGVGTATNIDYVKVTWLSGAVDFIENVSVNQFLTLVEGENSLSIGDQNFIDFIVYPNPSDGLFTIKVPSASSEFDIVVYDTRGRVVIKKNGMNVTNILLDMRGFSNGVYFIKSILANSFTVKKIIVN